eukprot:2398489-Amphidinium_carterae.1
MSGVTNEHSSNPEPTLPDPASRVVTNRVRYPKKQTLEDFHERTIEEEKRKQAQLRLGLPIRTGLAQGNVTSSEDHLPLQVLLNGKKGTDASTNQNSSKEPPTPRQHHDHDDNDEWTTVCCFCQLHMEENNMWSCCRCLHKCHFACRHTCDGDIVCVHCKEAHFLPGQKFNPPLTDAALRYNIAQGVRVAGSSKLKRFDQEQIEMMDQIARAEPVDQDTSGGSSALAVA